MLFNLTFQKSEFELLAFLQLLQHLLPFTLCSLFEGSAESFLAIHVIDLHKVFILLHVVFLTRNSQATGLLGCPVIVVPIAVPHVVHGMCTFMLLAEAAVLLGPIDQRLAGLL